MPMTKLPGEAGSPRPAPCSDNAYIMNKLNHIIIPRIEFREATVREALDFLEQGIRQTGYHGVRSG